MGMDPNDPSGGGGNPFGGMGGMFTTNMGGGMSGAEMGIDPNEIFKMFMGAQMDRGAGGSGAGFE